MPIQTAQRLLLLGPIECGEGWPNSDSTSAINLAKLSCMVPLSGGQFRRGDEPVHELRQTDRC